MSFTQTPITQRRAVKLPARALAWSAISLMEDRITDLALLELAGSTHPRIPQ